MRNHAAVWLLLILSIFLAPAAFASDTTYQTPGYGNRPYRVFLPDTKVGDRSFPVVLVFHGGGGDIEGIVRSTSMDATAQEHLFLAVYPSGISSRIGNFRTWNAGDCCGRASDQNIDDMTYVAAVLADLAKHYDIDTKRVYATGHSNGAMIAWRLACERPDLVAAIAPNSGNARLDLLTCKTGLPVPVLAFHGTADPCASYKSGPCGDCFGAFLRSRGIPMPEKKRECVGAVEESAEWAELQACAPETRVTLQKGAVTCTEHLGCPSGASVGLCSEAGAGHTWAGGRDDIRACEKNPDGKACKDWRAHVGPINRDISANEMIWAFFSRFHR